MDNRFEGRLHANHPNLRPGTGRGPDDAELFRRALELDPARGVALFDLARSLAGTGELEEVLVPLGERAMAITGGWWSSVSRYDSATHRLKTLVDFGATGDAVEEGLVFDVSLYPATLRVLTEQTAVQIRVDDDGADAGERELLAELDSGAVLMLPLVAQGESIGLFELHSKEPREFADDEVVFCRLLCDVVAAAVQNASLYDRLRRLAETDPLTGLWNRRVFDERLAAVLADPELMPASIAIIDVDGLKEINDRHGHPAGDRSLIAVAGALGAVRQGDHACRLGGDEFALILPRTTRAQACGICLRALRTLAGRHPQVEFSAGVATVAAPGYSPNALYRSADASVYRSKARRRQRVDGRPMAA